ncbi:hypothetical protein P171DRAFT_476790 [Karstenula rhodostoma CBS 690.94]|uniref:Uncharacterized protein n=1 Tax=Karstenula rhodostoma CBS 690.94 TaxID=1392251 RepID=A0A9P4PAL0_9PLEO|nr:hypothetical protein P171DRAFT_476790 [Karstenula rhodostoma CBS 690.94]
MDSNKSDPSPSDIAELQRDCHPFPAYIDYMQGRPTEYERLMENLELAVSDDQDENRSFPQKLAMGNPMAPADGSGVSAPYKYSDPPAPVPAAGSYPSPQSMHAAPPSSMLGNTMTSRIPSQPPGLRMNKQSRQNQQSRQKPSLFGSSTTTTGGGLIGGAQQNHVHISGAFGQNKPGGLQRLNAHYGSPPSLFAAGPGPTQLPAGGQANRPPMMRTNVTETQPQPMVMGTSQSEISAPLSAPPTNHAPKTSSASAVPKPPVLILQRDDLLKPAFNWMPQQARASTNDKVGHLRDIIASGDIPMSTRNSARIELLSLGAQVTEALFMLIHLRLLRNIHQTMPSLYDAKMVTRHYPNDHPENIKANGTIQRIRQQFSGPAQDYMKRLFEEMIKRASQGKMAYEAIPGWLEQWNREHAPKAPKENAAVQEVEMKQSKGESSPLPQWRAP